MRRLRRRGPGLGAALVACGVLGWSAAEAAPRHAWACGPQCQVGPRWPYPYGLDTAPRVFPLPQPPMGMPPLSFPEEESPFVPGPSGRPGAAPYPQGFVLDVPITPDRHEDESNASKPTLNRYREVADALARCWNPPAQVDGKKWEQTTLRVSFKRDGSINGMPLIPYIGGDLTSDARSGLTRSIMAALKGCVPLQFSSSLGAAVAGQIFALRFIEQDQD